MQLIPKIGIFLHSSSGNWMATLGSAVITRRRWCNCRHGRRFLACRQGNLPLLVFLLLKSSFCYFLCVWSCIFHFHMLGFSYVFICKYPRLGGIHIFHLVHHIPSVMIGETDSLIASLLSHFLIIRCSVLCCFGKLVLSIVSYCAFLALFVSCLLLARKFFLNLALIVCSFCLISL